MRDIIEICRTLEEKYGEDIWINSFIPPSGHYFKINKDNSVEHLFLNNANKKDYESTEIYTYIRDRMFYEGTIMYSANKMIHNKKKIHSVTSNSIIFKYENFENIKDYLGLHFEVLTKNYLTDKDSLLLTNEYLGYIEKAKEKMAGVTEKIKASDRIIIFKEEDLETYKKEFNIYLSEKIYLSNETEIVINEESFGVFSVATTLDDKKPLITNPYASGNDKSQKSIFRLNFNDCSLLVRALKLDSLTLTKLLQSENKNIAFNYSATGDISEYNTNYKLFTNHKKSFENISILESLYKYPVSETIEGNREKLKSLIDKLSSYQLSKLLNIKDRDYKSYIDESPNKKIGTSFVDNKEIFDFYFNKNGKINIEKAIKNISEIIIETSVLNGKYNFIDNQEKFDLSLTILNYLNKNGGYIDMANNIKEIWLKLITAKNDEDCNEFEIESDKEFFFIAGQILNYLSSLSKSSNKSGLLIQDVFNIKDLNEAKEKMNFKYNKYMYLISMHEKNFINIIFRALIEYKIDENVKINSNNNFKNYYTAGLIGKNIFYTKKEKNEKTIIDSEGENDNEEK